jgi:SpoVK/Ycf46/Vps4 family AAA+-type ATPase
VTQSRFVADLDMHVRARYPLLYLVSWEESRVDRLLADLAARHQRDLICWSVTRGLHRLAGRASSFGDGCKDPLEALAQVERLTAPSLVVLKDFHPYLNDPTIVRAVRELTHELKSTSTTLFVVGPVLNLPVELEKEASVFDVPLPTFHELAQLLREIISVLWQGDRTRVDLTNEEGERLVRAAMGLTMSEAENAFAKAIAADNKLSADDIPLILEEKRQVIRKSGLLEYHATDAALSGVGGLDLLKGWLDQRTAAFGEAARRFGLPEPRGVLLLGVQGCGKSLTAKAVASHWRLPLLRLDMGRVFSGLVGSSEENLRRAIRVAEGIAPAVLWVDEIEKGMAGMASSGSTDSGVTARVLGTFLTWLQEKTSPVFVVATANRIEGLPPELLRKGRFDEIFFIDLPSPAERRDIFDIHLRRRQRDPAAFELEQLVRESPGFSGAEIEQAVVAALYSAFGESADLRQQHVVRALAETHPLSTTMREEIERLRLWARDRTRPASSEGARPATGGDDALASRFGRPP